VDMEGGIEKLAGEVISPGKSNF